MATFFRLLLFLRPYRWRVAFGLVCLIALVGLELAPPLVWKYVVDAIVVQRRWAALIPAIVGLVIIQGADAIVSALRTRLLESVGQQFVFDLRNKLYDVISSQSLEFFNEAQTGDLISRLSSDVDAVQDVIISGTDSVIANFLRLVGVAFIFCALNLKLGLATLIPIILVGVLLKLFNGQVKGLYKQARQSLGMVNAKLQENISGIRVIKAYARERSAAIDFRQSTRRYLTDNLAAIRIRSLFFPFVRWIASFGNTIMIGYGAYLILQGQFTVGGLVAYRGYGRYFFGPIDDLTQINDTVQRAIAAGNRLFEVLDAPVSVVDRSDAISLPPVRGEIIFDRVSFAYQASMRPVLDDVSFRIAPGQTAALVGESGAGKSTIFALVSRFWDPTAGHVRIDGHALTDVTQDSLREQMAAVQQETFLFAASVAENIRYARPSATVEEIEAAAHAANAHGFITKLVDGYDTLIGERGVKLSGGQRQRLSVARAFLANPRLLLLDEATSAVEPESEQIIQEAIERLMQGRTTVIATHRLSTIRRADLILVLQHGQLVEQGTHDQLIQQGGLYQRMVSQQSGGAECLAV